MSYSKFLPFLVILGFAIYASAPRAFAQPKQKGSEGDGVTANPTPIMTEDDDEAEVEQQFQMETVKGGTKKPKAPSSGGGTRAPRSGGGGGGSCGKEFWGVKTLTDADAGAVQLHNIQDTTVHALVSSPSRPPAFGSGTPGGGYQMPADKRIVSGPYSELGVYRIKATVTTYKLESDSDFHIVAKDPDTGETMIVESVDSSCASGSSSANTFTMVRQQFAEIFSTPPGAQFINVNQPVTIIGVGFYDPPHKQTGAAPNARELHPVLCISAGAECDSYQ